MKKLLASLAAVLFSTGVMAGTKPFNLSLTPDIAVYDRSETIEGLTLSIWGQNEQTSLALGIANGSIGQSAGLSVGILNYAADYKGVQWGLVNYAKDDVTGWQGGFLFGLVGSVVNATEGNMKGFQAGAVNYAGKIVVLPSLSRTSPPSTRRRSPGRRTACPARRGNLPQSANAATGPRTIRRW